MYKLAVLILGVASVFTVVLLFHAAKLHRINKERRQLGAKKDASSTLCP